MSKDTISERFDTLLETYRSLFLQCADALAPETPQEERDALRKNILNFLEVSYKSPSKKSN